MTCITIFLTADEYHGVYREARSEADAIQRIRTAKVVQFDLAAEPVSGILEKVFAVTNGVADTPEQQASERAYRADGETRSLSVGDVVHAEGVGIFSVTPMGWKRHDHRLTANAAGHAVRRTFGLEAQA